MTFLRHLQTPGRAASVALATATLGLASPAAAAVEITTCSLANGVLTVDMRGDTTIDYASSVIVVHSGVPRACTGGQPTTLNTDAVRLIDHQDDPSTPEPFDGNTVLTIDRPGSYAPGRTPESGSLSEVEFVANMNGGDDRLIAITRPDSPAYWTAGTAGINWNADNDPDLFGAFDHIHFHGSRHADLFSARGGDGTGQPLVRPKLSITAGEGDDELLGSDGSDYLSPEAGNDVVGGFAGDDAVVDSPGDDSLAGGTGIDSVSFQGAPRGVELDLRTVDTVEASGRNTVADFEDVFGTDHADTLIGTDGANHFSGYRGDDTLVGLGGFDRLRGGEGGDTASYADGRIAINADLGAGRVTQGIDIDTLEDVEHVTGSPFADVLSGSAAANRLVGGAGADAVSGGGGADRIDLRDGEADAFLNCGDDPAIDTVLADRRGIDPANADCETIDYAPEPLTEPGQPTPDGGPGGEGNGPGGAGEPGAGAPQGTTPDRTLSFTLRGASSQRVLGRGGVRVQVRCPQEHCDVAITAAVSSSKRPSRRQTTTSRSSATVVAGAMRAVQLRLSGAQRTTLRRALAAGRRPALTVRAEARDAAGNRVVRTLRVRVVR